MTLDAEPNSPARRVGPWLLAAAWLLLNAALLWMYYNPAQ